MAMILNGAPVAEKITENARKRAQELGLRGIEPTLAILRVGEKPADLAYERAAGKRCRKAGVRVESFALSARCTQETLMDSVALINGRTDIHGCLILRPLPAWLDERAACAALAPEKDVDGVTALSLSALLTGNGSGFAPCTARACMELMDYYGVEISGRRAVVIGRSLVIGKPIALMLLARDATVTVCHSKTPDLSDICRQADILIAAAGRANMVDARFTNSGQAVIDVGMNAVDGGALTGDARFEELEGLASAVSPVPGGVGAVTTAVLAAQVVEAAERQTL